MSAGNAFAQSDQNVLRFADLGGIRDWRADTDKALLVEGENRNWYRATFYTPCVGLRFAQAVAFVTEPSGSLDRFSSILVQGERCWFKTFARTDPPSKGGKPMMPQPVDPNAK
jgi:hypothetical protein